MQSTPSGLNSASSNGVSNRPRQPSDRAALDIDVLRYLGMLKSRWLLVGGIMLGSMGLAALAVLMQSPTYTADAKLLVQVDRTSSLTGFGEGVGQLDPLVSAQNPLSTEVEVIASRPVLQTVIEQLNLRNGEGERLTPGDLHNKLTIEIVGGADVIRISFDDANPELAAAVVNSLADVYIDYNLQENSGEASEALALLEARLPESEAFVSQAEAALRSFKERYSIVSLPEEAQLTVSNLNQLEDQVLAASVALREVDVRSQQLRDNLGLDVQQAILVSELSQSPAIQGALLELQSLERQQSVELGFYTAQAPTVQVYEAQIASLRGLLQSEIASIVGNNQSVQQRFLQAGEAQQAQIARFVEVEAERFSLAARLDALEYALSLYQERGSIIPQLEQDQAELERNLEVARSSYQNLLQKVQDLRSAENQVVENVRLIEPAIVPDEASSTSKVIILLGGFVVGAFLSTTAVALLEMLRISKQKAAEGSLVTTAEGDLAYEENGGSPPPNFEPSEFEQSNFEQSNFEQSNFEQAELEFLPLPEPIARAARNRTAENTEQKNGLNSH